MFCILLEYRHVYCFLSCLEKPKSHFLVFWQMWRMARRWHGFDRWPQILSNELWAMSVEEVGTSACSVRRAHWVIIARESHESHKIIYCSKPFAGLARVLWVRNFGRCTQRPYPPHPSLLIRVPLKNERRFLRKVKAIQWGMKGDSSAK